MIKPPRRRSRARTIPQQRTGPARPQFRPPSQPRRSRRARPTATTRGPQGLPIQAKSPQRRVRPKTITSRGPQGLPIQASSPQRKPRRQALPRRFKSDAAQGAPTKRQQRAIDKGAAEAKTRVTLRRRNARTLNFPDDAFGAAKRSQRRAIESLAELKASNPKRYQERKDRATRSWTDQALRDVGNTVDKGLKDAAKGVEDVSKLTNKITGGNLKNIQTAGQRTTGANLRGSIDPSKAGKEVIDIVANTPSGAYLAGAAAFEAAKGRPQRAKKLFKDFKQTSALAPAAEAIGRNIQGKGASKQWKEAAKRAEERPITTGLELSGVKAVVGRTGGAAARVAPSKRVRQMGSTDRPNLRLDPSRKPGEGPEDARRYSKDIINKGIQVAAERRTRKGSRVRRDGTQRRPGRDPNVDAGSYLVPALPRRAGGAHAHPGTPVYSRLRRRVDTRQFAQDRAGTARRDAAVKKVGKAVKRKNATGVQLHAEGVIRGNDVKTLRKDIHNRRLRLAKAAQGLTDPERKRLNAKERKDLRELEALADDKLLRVVEGARQFSKDQQAVQARGRRVGLFEETAQAKRFFPPLQSHARRTAGETKVKGAPVDAGVQRVLERRVRRGQAIPERAYAAAQESALARMPAEAKLSHAPDPRTVAAEFKRAGGTLPVIVRPFRSEAKMEGRRGGYAGIKTDRATGQSYHLVYYNPKHGAGARNQAVWFEMGRALRNERKGGFNPTEKMTPAQYRATGGFQSAQAFALRNMDVDLGAPPRLESLAARGRGNLPGQRKGMQRADFNPFLEGVRRRVREPGRRLDQDELLAASRVLQRRSRRGQALPPSMPEGGPAFITQRPGSGRGRAAAFPTPENMSRVRGGTAFEQGARGVGREALERQASMAERTTTAMEGFQLIDREFGRPATLNGQRYADSYGEALETARLLQEEHGMGYTPVNIAAFREFGVRLRRKQEEGTPSSLRESQDLQRSTAETWNAATQESGRGRWVLMPEDVVERFRAHADVNAHGVLHGATNLFKDVVLTTSSPARWIGGNITDISMRTAFAGITPLDIVRGSRIVRRAAQEGLQGEQASAATTGGGLYHAAEALNRSVGRVPGENIGRTVLAAPFRTWKGMVYAIEHSIEVLPQQGAVGKAFRQETGRKAQVKLPVAQTRRATPEQFERAVNKTPNAEGYLTPYTRADYAKMETYLAPDGKSGFALRGDELVNLFALPGAKFRGTQVLAAAERRGATRLDATSVRGGGLEKFYGKRGWRVDREEPWDTQYGAAPAEGSRVVFMSRNPRAQRAADLAMKSDLKSMLKLHDEQINSYAHKLATDRATEARIQKVTEDVIGRWGKVSPAMRQALVVAPFAQWLGAATRYVYVTLPVHHPIKTGILAGISEMTEKERMSLGLSYFLPRDKQVYDYQMGTLPLEVGKNKYGKVLEGVRTARMTSLGTAGTTPGNLGEFLFPQFAGALDAWAGTSFTHEQLVYPDWWPEENLRRTPMPPDELHAIGLGALLESSVPFASAFRRSILEEGRPAEPYSTILTPATRKKFDKEDKEFKENKGTAMGGILEWLSPFAPKSRVYTYGAGKAIEEQGITGETLERWRKQPRPSRKNDPLGFTPGGRPETKAPVEDDPYGFGGAPSRKPRKDSNPYGF